MAAYRTARVTAHLLDHGSARCSTSTHIIKCKPLICILILFAQTRPDTVRCRRGDMICLPGKFHVLVAPEFRRSIRFDVIEDGMPVSSWPLFVFSQCTFVKNKIGDLLLYQIFRRLSRVSIITRSLSFFHTMTT